MKVSTLTGDAYEWKLPRRNKRKTSSYHKIAKQILKELYPNFSIYEETPILIKRRKTLFLDFYIKNLNLAIEIHGIQHYTFSSLFHETKLDFLKQRQNDQLKQEWCELNNISFLPLDYREEQEWSIQIKNYEY